MKKTDIVIIGSGMAGITAALYLKRAAANFVLLEGTLAGGMLNQLKTIENFPTIPSATGSDILISLMEQLRFNNIPVTYGNVQTILKEDGGFEVVTDVDSYDAKAVIVATGVSHESNSIKGEEEYAGNGVSYCATCDGNFFKDLDIAVVGNNNICLEETIYLAGLAKQIYLVCPDEELSGDAKLIEKLAALKNVEILYSSEVNEIVGDSLGVTGIKVNDRIIEVSGVFPYVGKKTTSQILNNLKPEKDGVFLVVNDQKMTNIPGLFGAGDVISKKLRQLVTAAGDGATAAIEADKYCKLQK